MATKKKTKARGKTRKKSAAASSPAMDLIVAALKKNKNVAYADVKVAADKKGLTIFPIMFGRAKLLLGHVKAKPKKAGKRGPGRPRKSATRSGGVRAASGPMAAVQDLISNLEDHASQNAKMREALEEIGHMIDRVMGNSAGRTRRA